ncbi:MAG: hypothetical protein AABY27_06460 [Pseudomonadota bacterium]
MPQHHYRKEAAKRIAKEKAKDFLNKHNHDHWVEFDENGQAVVSKKKSSSSGSAINNNVNDTFARWDWCLDDEDEYQEILNNNANNAPVLNFVVPTNTPNEDRNNTNNNQNHVIMEEYELVNDGQNLLLVGEVHQSTGWFAWFGGK